MVANRRLGRGAFFGLWLPLALGQLGILSATLSVEPSFQPEVGWGLIALLQLLKLPITAMRLEDVGKPPSDALFYVLLPVANLVGLLSTMPEATPSASAWEKRRKGWASQLGPLEALGRALPLAARTAVVGLPLAALYGAVMAGGGWWVMQQLDAAAKATPETREMLTQGFGAIAAFLGLYTAVQFTKRATATRLSWLPSLFFLPAVLTAAAFGFFDAGVQNNVQFMIVMLAYSAWLMIWMSLGGAALMVGVTLAAEQVRVNGSVDAGQVFGQLGSRTLDVAGPHGARIQAVSIGMQVLIPGIFYRLQLAFADAIAVLEPNTPALSRSGELTWGMRGRLFKLFLASYLMIIVVHFAIVAALGSTEQAMAYWLNAADVEFAPFLLGEIAWGCFEWIVQLALLLLYHDRLRYLAERKAERAAEKAAAAAVPSPA